MIMLLIISRVLNWMWCKIKVFETYVRYLYWPKIYKYFVSKERYRELTETDIRNLQEKNRELDV